jgi:hypothetical protein
VRINLEWCPSKNHFSANRWVLPDEIEELTTHFIWINFVPPGRPIHQPILKPLILTLVQDFKCSSHFMSRFLNQVNLNSRKTQAARRPEIDDKECVEFMVKPAAPYQSYPDDHMINLDESSWRFVQVGDRVIADRGS